MDYTLKQGQAQLRNYLIKNKVISQLTPSSCITINEAKIIHDPTYHCTFTIKVPGRKTRTALAVLNLTTQEKILLTKYKQRGEKKCL